MKAPATKKYLGIDGICLTNDLSVNIRASKAMQKAIKKAISGLKYHIGTAGKHVGQEAVQLHGGMGISWELDIAHLFKRLSAIEILFGNADFHLERFIKLSNN